MSTLRVMKWEDMIYYALVATLWRTASKYWNDVYHYEECWFAAVSCICLRDFQLFRWWIVYTSSQRFCWVIWNVLMKHSDVDLWTAEMSFQYNVRLMNELHLEFSVTGWTASSRHLYGFRSGTLLLQRLLMQHFSSSVHHLPHLQPGRWTFIMSSLVSTKTFTSSLQLKLWIVIDNISSQLRETV